jgi:hypothetical protein
VLESAAFPSEAITVGVQFLLYSCRCERFQGVSKRMGYIRPSHGEGEKKISEVSVSSVAKEVSHADVIWMTLRCAFMGGVLK